MHDLDEISVVLHGGEPSLAGEASLDTLLTDLRAAVPRRCRIRFLMQTNGVRLDASFIAMLHAHGTRIGVSLDGPAADNDRHRRRPDGRGSHAAVEQTLALLTGDTYRSAFAGLLCTVDPAIDPIACYESLLRYGPPAIDFLLPHANWSAPPARRPNAPGAPAAPHADWLIRIFDRWYDAPMQETSIRFFEEIINLVLGGSSRSEQIGLSPATMIVIESDGAIEQVDALKSAYSGACATGLHVRTNAFDEALAHPGIVARQIGVHALCTTCQQCPVRDVCGGGHYAHRYRAGSGFQNPSVYCGDLMRLIEHISRRIRRDRARLGGG